MNPQEHLLQLPIKLVNTAKTIAEFKFTYAVSKGHYSLKLSDDCQWVPRKGSVRPHMLDVSTHTTYVLTLEHAEDDASSYFMSKYGTDYCYNHISHRAVVSLSKFDEEVRKNFIMSQRIYAIVKPLSIVACSIIIQGNQIIYTVSDLNKPTSDQIMRTFTHDKAFTLEYYK